MHGGVGTHSDHFIVIIQDRGKCISPFTFVVPFHEQTAVVITDSVAESSDVGCDHWSAARLRLKRNKSKGLVV